MTNPSDRDAPGNPDEMVTDTVPPADPNSATKRGEPPIGPCIMDPAFHGCVRASLDTPELVENFDRLYGYNLSRRGTPIEVAVDDITGRTEAGVRAFMVFVRDCVYTRLAPDVLAEIRATVSTFISDAATNEVGP